MTKTLAILAATLAFASALADGFLVSTNAIAPEERAALEALCARLEARGLARVPAGAKWRDVSADRSLHYRSASFDDIGFESGHESEHAWLLREGGDGTNDYMNADGYCFRSAAPLSRPARLSRDVALLAGRLERAAAANAQSAAAVNAQSAVAAKSENEEVGEDEEEEEEVDVDEDEEMHELEILAEIYEGFDDAPDKGKSPRLALLFAAELFRAGHEDEACAIFRAIESFGDLDGIERGAADMLAESDALAARDMLAETGDFAATAAFLEKSLVRNPAKPATPDDKDVFASLPKAVRRTLPPRRDFRKAFLEAMRRRLNGIPAVPGLGDEEQKLAADLAEWKGWQVGDRGEYELKKIPWLIPAAWTNNPAIPDNAATRIARLGPRAISLLMALQDDETPARRPQNHINDSSLFMTRGRVAYDLLNQLLPFDMHSHLAYKGEEVERAAIQREILDVGPDDLLLLYLRDNAGDYSDMPLLWAYLARRLESEIPFLETAILAAVTNRPIDESLYLGNLVLTGDAALRMADLCLAVRGEAAASFRERLCAALRRLSVSFEFPKPQVSPLPGGGEKCVFYFSRDKKGFVSAFRTWALKTAETFAGIELQDGSPAAVHARAEAAAAWFLGNGGEIWASRPQSGIWQRPPLSSLPPPLPFVSIGAPDSDPVKSRPGNLRRSSLVSSGKIADEEIEKRMKELEEEAAELERLRHPKTED